MANSELIVVLDDDASVLGAVERVLRRHGFDVQAFGSVDGFLRDARLDEASCLVLDINLKGRSGIDLRRDLECSGVALPVIFITGGDNEAAREAAREAGCVAYLHKPFTSRLLIDAIEQAV